MCECTVCVSVHMWVYTNTCLSVQVWWVYKWVHVSVHVHMCVCTCVCAQVYVCLCVHMRECAHVSVKHFIFSLSSESRYQQWTVTWVPMFFFVAKWNEAPLSSLVLPDLTCYLCIFSLFLFFTLVTTQWNSFYFESWQIIKFLASFQFYRFKVIELNIFKVTENLWIMSPHN